MTVKYPVIICLLLLSLSTSAQSKSKPKKDELQTIVHVWSEGSIMLSDGTELKGLLRFDDRNGVLSYQNGEQSRSFTPKSVVGFEYFDEAFALQRVFYSLEMKNENGFMQHFFFERLKEYKDFAVLSRAEPLLIKTENFGNSYDPTNTVGQPQKIWTPNGEVAIPGAATPAVTIRPYSSTTTSQVSTIFLMKADGTIEPYIKQTNMEVDHNFWFDFTKQKNKFVGDEDLLADYIGKESYKQLKDYAKKHELAFRKQNDFLKIIKYYDHIRTE